MKVVGVTYATAEFEPYARLLAGSAARCGVSEFVVYRPVDLPTDFRQAHRSILSAKHGAGYWMWKAWAIGEQLARLDEGDVVRWVDAATHFIGPVQRIADFMDQHALDVWLMGEGFRESQYTERDAFVLLVMDRPDVDPLRWVLPASGAVVQRGGREFRGSRNLRDDLWMSRSLNRRGRLHSERS